MKNPNDKYKKNKYSNLDNWRPRRRPVRQYQVQKNLARHTGKIPWTLWAVWATPVIVIICFVVLWILAK